MADSLKHQLLWQAQKQLRTEVNSSAIRKNGSSEIFYEFWIFIFFCALKKDRKDENLVAMVVFIY